MQRRDQFHFERAILFLPRVLDVIDVPISQQLPSVICFTVSPPLFLWPPSRARHHHHCLSTAKQIGDLHSAASALCPQSEDVDLVNEVSRARRLLLKGMAAGLVGGMWSPQIFARSDEFRTLPKAMWVWLKSLDELDRLSQFALTHGFDALMIHFGKVARAEMRDPASPALRILRDLKSQGCDCFALAGEPQWAQRAELPKTIIELLELQQRHVVFDGLHLDVEPHSLPQWRQPGGRAALMRGMADLAIRTRDAMPSKMSLQLALNPKHAMQPLADGGSFFRRIAPHVQEVALMAYRDTPRRQLKAANDAAVQLRKIGLPWRMGVLTSSTEEVGVSYYGLPSESFEAQMQELWRELALERQCQGLSFENYHSMQSMLRPVVVG